MRNCGKGGKDQNFDLPNFTWGKDKGHMHQIIRESTKNIKQSKQQSSQQI